MAFDWIQVFEARGVEYVTSGPNVARGHAAVHCPFCGHQDPSQHMSVNLSGSGWRCWRKPSDHRGKNPAKLIQALLNCSYEQAKQIVGGSVFIPEDFMDRVNQQLNPKPKVELAPLSLMPEFLPIKDVPSARLFYRYLHDKRGFTEREIWTLTKYYGMRYCTRGPYKGRIIFPIGFKEKLVTWTGRTVYPSEELRYKALSYDPEKAAKEGLPPAHGPISHFLLWYDDLQITDADTIVLCEGPFDSLKVRVLGRQHGIHSSCFFTAEPTVPQLDLLHEILPRFKHRYLLLDKRTLPTALKIMGRLSGLQVQAREVPPGVKDPGEFSSTKQLLAVL